MNFKCIDVPTAQNLIAEEQAQVVDIRDPQSYALGSIENSFHVSDHNVEEFIQQANPELPLIVCCYHGNNSQPAAAFFADRGFKQAYSLDGGYAAWRIQKMT